MRAGLLAAVAACGVVAATVWWQWPAPPEDQVHAYTTLQDFDYSLLEGHARGLAMAKARQGFDFHSEDGGAAAFQVRCKGVVVMDVQNTPPLMRVRLPADALSRAPDIERLHSHFQGCWELRRAMWWGLASRRGCRHGFCACSEGCRMMRGVCWGWMWLRVLEPVRWGQSPFLRKGL